MTGDRTETDDIGAQDILDTFDGGGLMSYFMELHRSEMVLLYAAAA